MGYYSYIIRRDFGFAPNPFGQYCTLATCKPKIRKKAQVGDWIFGTGSAEYKKEGHLIYCMKITDKISFSEYWNDKRFQYKKPIMNGSLTYMYGDNIYHYDEDNKLWLQESSHHSLSDGSINEYNLNRDISGEFVLISDHFFYFGKNSFYLPDEFRNDICKKGPGYKSKTIIAEKAEKLIANLNGKFGNGYFGDPNQFGNSFERYDGRS